MGLPTRWESPQSIWHICVYSLACLTIAVRYMMMEELNDEDEGVGLSGCVCWLSALKDEDEDRCT